MQGDFGRVSVLARAHILGVFDRGQGDVARGGTEAAETDVVGLGGFAEFCCEGKGGKEGGREGNVSGCEGRYSIRVKAIIAGGDAEAAKADALESTFAWQRTAKIPLSLPPSLLKYSPRYCPISIRIPIRLK
jgi:hypothetical protein